jgi:hypothetical protein
MMVPVVEEAFGKGTAESNTWLKYGTLLVVTLKPVLAPGGNPPALAHWGYCDPGYGGKFAFLSVAVGMRNVSKRNHTSGMTFPAEVFKSCPLCSSVTLQKKTPF